MEFGSPYIEMVTGRPRSLVVRLSRALRVFPLFFFQFPRTPARTSRETPEAIKVRHLLSVLKVRPTCQGGEDEFMAAAFSLRSARESQHWWLQPPIPTGVFASVFLVVCLFPVVALKLVPARKLLTWPRVHLFLFFFLYFSFLTTGPINRLRGERPRKLPS